MREHAIPQDVTGYRFHIIGNMTLKQFAEVGAGVLLGVFIYATNLPTIIKWPFICIVVGLGAMAAFVPFEERPFDHWIVTFFKVLYKPTKFYWKRQSKIPDPFLYNLETDDHNLPPELDLRPARRERIKEYLTSVEPTVALNQFDAQELERLKQIMGAFDTVKTKVESVNKTQQKPDLKVRVRAIKPHAGDLEFLQDRMSREELERLGNPAEAVIKQDVNKTHLEVQQVAHDIQIPEVKEITMETSNVSAEDATFQNTNGASDERAFVITADADNTAPEVSQAATINADLPFPLPPTEPNKLVGMILTPTNNLINDAIIEIVDATTNRVARAVKSNALGQFFITTPLENGTYTISVEHDGYQFSPISLQLEGKVVPPIEIRSTT